MKLTGDLKKQVEKAESKDEKKSLIENAGMLLNDDELEQVSGGSGGLQKVTAYCYYCGTKHLLTCCTGLNIISHGLNKMMGGATSYFCTTARQYFYTLELRNGETAILDSNLKIVIPQK